MKAPILCFLALAFSFVTLAQVGAISGPSGFCNGTTATYTDTTAGGTWTSSNSSIATIVTGTGIASGVSPGVVNLTYTVGSAFATKTVTVYTTPAAITGPSNICFGTGTAFGNSTTGGSWSSSNTAVVSIGSSSGIAVGLVVGSSALITYTLGTGCYTVMPVTVVAAPAAITGPATVCSGTTITLSNSTTGGVWSSGSVTLATVGLSTGIVSGMTSGVATISYTLSSGCYATYLVTVTSTPSITGPTGICIGSTATYTSGTGGGTWTTGSSTITIGSSSGIVTGASLGVGVLTYTASSSCIGTYSINVVSAPTTIGGSSAVCAGSTMTLTSSVSGGVWSSSSPAIGTVGATSGIVTGMAAGVTTITYTMAPGCYVTKPVSVNVLPGPISGPPVLCTGTSATYSSSTGGGTWTSSNTSIATIGSTGTALGITSGTSVLTYTMPTGCITTKSITVSSTPSSISGTLTVCTGSTTTLSASPSGGTWTSSIPGVAAIGSSTGVATGVSAGTAVITYTSPTACYATTVVTVLPTPSPITGPTSVCVGATISLSSSTSGGTWSCTPSSIAVFGTAGLTGLSTGVATVVYSVSSTGCSTTTTVTVYATPTAYTVSGGGTYCSGASIAITLSNSQTGVSYQLYNGSTPVGSPISGTGAGLTFSFSATAGTYTVVANPGTSCATTMTGTVTVVTNPLPTAYTVTGGGGYCAGGTGVLVGLSGSALGTTYQLYCSGTLVGAASGTGSPISFGLQLTAGVYTVVGTNATTGCTGSMTGSVTVVVNPLPTAYTVTGGGTYSGTGPGLLIGLTGSTSGTSYQLMLGGTPIGSPLSGTGSSLNFGLFTIAGTYTIVGTNTTTGCARWMTGNAIITVGTGLSIFTVTGGGSYCAGGTGVAVGLSGSQTGVSYQLFNGTTVTGSPVTGTGSPISFGLQTAAGIYTVVANPGTTSITAMSGSVTVTILSAPSPFTVTGGGAYCSGGTGVTIGLSGSQAGVIYFLYNGSTVVGGPVTGTGSAISFGLYTAVGTYGVVANPGTPCAATMTGTVTVSLITSPAAFTVTGGGNYCAGGAGFPVGLSGSQTGVSYQLYNGTTTVGSALAGTGSAISFGL